MPPWLLSTKNWRLLCSKYIIVLYLALTSPHPPLSSAHCRQNWSTAEVRTSAKAAVTPTQIILQKIYFYLFSFCYDDIVSQPDVCGIHTLCHTPFTPDFSFLFVLPHPYQHCYTNTFKKENHCPCSFWSLLITTEAVPSLGSSSHTSSSVTVLVISGLWKKRGVWIHTSHRWNTQGCRVICKHVCMH